MGIYIKDVWGNNRIIISVILARNQKIETPIETIFSREIVNIHRGHWINPQKNGVTTGYSVQARQGIKSNRSNLGLLAKRPKGSQLSIANKTFLGSATQSSPLKNNAL